jgi:hypothetical protein
MTRETKLMSAASAIALCATMAATSLSSQTLGGVGADSRAKAINALLGQTSELGGNCG